MRQLTKEQRPAHTVSLADDDGAVGLHADKLSDGASLRKARLRRFIVIGGIALGVLVLAPLLLFGGFQAHRHEIAPLFSFFDKVDRKLQRTFFLTPSKLGAKQYSSTLINLSATVAIVETGRSSRAAPLAENGGGLASFQDELLLLPYNGRIYSVRGAGEVHETKIAGPRNNRDAYQSLARDADLMAAHEFEFSYLRYNDLVFFDTGAKRGLLASYTEFHPESRCYTNSLATLPIDRTVTSIDQVAAGPDDWRVVFRTAPCLPLKTEGYAMEGQMAGGRMVFEAPSTVYLTSGDYHFDGMRSLGAPVAQDPTAHYGKVLKVDIESGSSQIVSMGHRNPQGIVMMPDKTLLVVEHGPNGGDELNRIRPGANYGWPLESYGVTYRGVGLTNAVSFGRHDTFERPLFSWVPSISASSIAYLQDFDAAWDGDLLIGSLTDMSLHRVRLEGDRVVYAERIPIGSRIRDIHQHSNGKVVLWTDNEELIFLESRPRVDEQLRREDFLDGVKLSSATRKGLQTALDRCTECHNLMTDQPDARSPGLARIFGADIASADYRNYSSALRSKPGQWTRENLAAYLSDPNAFAPGTYMPDPNIRDPRVVDAVIDYLAALRVDH